MNINFKEKRTEGKFVVLQFSFESDAMWNLVTTPGVHIVNNTAVKVTKSSGATIQDFTIKRGEKRGEVLYDIKVYPHSPQKSRENFLNDVKIFASHFGHDVKVEDLDPILVEFNKLMN